MTLLTVPSLTGDQTGPHAPYGDSKRRSNRARWICVFALCFVVWLTMRMVFFVGVTGSDDMYYLRYAALWDRTLTDHWEARLLGNALTAVSLRLFGLTEVAALP